GLKPTERRIANTGHIPEPPGEPRAVRHMNVLGPLARSVEDLALITKTISGPDDAEWDLAPVPWLDAPEKPLRECRVAWSTDFGDRKVPYFIAGTAYTCPFNLTGNPSVVLPLTKSKDGLPIGVQLVGKRWSEPELLAVAQKVALITGPFTPPPKYKQ